MPEYDALSDNAAQNQTKQPFVRMRHNMGHDVAVSEGDASGHHTMPRFVKMTHDAELWVRMHSAIHGREEIGTCVNGKRKTESKNKAKATASDRCDHD